MTRALVEPLALARLPRVSAAGSAAPARLPWAWAAEPGRTVTTDLAGIGSVRLACTLSFVGFASVGFASAEATSSEAFGLLDGEGRGGHIAVDRWFALNIVAATLGLPPPLVLRRLGALERGVLAGHLAALLAGTADGITVDLFERRPGPPRGEGARLVALALRAEAAGAAGPVRLDVPFEWLARRSRPSLELGAFRALAGRLATQASIELASTSLRLAELQTAGVGDALVFDGSAFPAASDRSVQVRIGDHEAPAVARNSGEGEIVLAGAFRAAAARAGATANPRATPLVVRKAGTMAAKADEDEAKVMLLGAAPIEVVAELGRMILRGDEVLALEKGSVLTLGRRGSSQADAVDLVVGGRPWARGELVNVDGELGVRITELVRP